ncbi:MAG: TenA family protein [Candidatus Caldatribacteriaceae bacterium]
MEQEFFAELRKKVQDQWEAILEHPFLRELALGVLPKEKFFFYLSQDDYYLEEMLSAVGVLVAKAGGKALRRFAVRLLHETVQGEVAMHEFLEREEGFSPVSPSAVTLEYGDFLVRTAYTFSPFEILVALAPCFVSYRDIGLRYHKRLTEGVPPFYRTFLASYASREYGGLVEGLLSFLEEEARSATPLQRELACVLFERAVTYEWRFWEESYRFPLLATSKHAEEDESGKNSEKRSTHSSNQTYGG